MEPSLETRLEVIDRAGIFENISRKDRQDLAVQMQARRAEPGEVICHEGEAGSTFFLVADGEATVTIGGSEVGHLGPGDFFGEISLIDGGPATASVTTA